MKYKSLAMNLPRRSSKKLAAGFTYVGLLILLVIMAIISTVALQIGGVTHRRVAEESLLNVGHEFSLALDSYKRASKNGEPDEPASLQDLLRDPRFPGEVRHLRKLYHDPLTGQADWGILRSEDTRRIIGIFSLSSAKPIKIANFDLALQDFSGKSSYQEWVFTGSQASISFVGMGKLTSPLDLLDDPQTDPTGDPATPSATNSLFILPPGLTAPRDLMD
jgi:type II secretory pathway pseudopilin PulG